MRKALRMNSANAEIPPQFVPQLLDAFAVRAAE
jgi:hypothetical protein